MLSVGSPTFVRQQNCALRKCIDHRLGTQSAALMTPDRRLIDAQRDTFHKNMPTLINLSSLLG
jgi:hypothetical protein